MPIIYLSPSTQESNLFVSGGSEEQDTALAAFGKARFEQSGGTL